MEQKIISGTKELRQFREKLTAERLLSALQMNNGKMLVSLAVGVGKSRFIDDLIDTVLADPLPKYELTVVLCSQKKIIRERRLVKRGGDAPFIILKPRPRKLCGVLNKEWKTYEQRGLSLYAKDKLCRQCKDYKNCEWLWQYDTGIQDKDIIFATHAHLENQSDFIDFLAKKTGKMKVLVLVDESSFLFKPFKRTLQRSDLDRFYDAVKQTIPSCIKNKGLDSLCAALERLVAADNKTLQESYDFPMLSNFHSTALQKTGVKLFNNKFRNIYFDLIDFGHSESHLREIADNRDILFTAIPVINHDCIIFCGTSGSKLIQYRLGHKFANPFARYIFKHPKTQWYNLASSIGTEKYFKGQPHQVLDFFASLVSRRLNQGKRVVLVVKKRLAQFCQTEMEQRLHDLGHKDLRIIYKKYPNAELNNPNVVPMISYGMQGINKFKKFDCAYCLTSYYVNQDAITNLLHDKETSNNQLPIQIVMEENPRRRKAIVVNPDNQPDPVSNNNIVQLIFEYLEIGTVIQAVGRVRPFTKPREVITFQCGEFNNIELTKEFPNLLDMRIYFDIQGRRDSNREKRSKLVQDAKTAGLTQKKTAKKLKLGIATIKRYWNKQSVTADTKKRPEIKLHNRLIN